MAIIVRITEEQLRNPGDSNEQNISYELVVSCHGAICDLPYDPDEPYPPHIHLCVRGYEPATTRRTYYVSFEDRKRH